MLGLISQGICFETLLTCAPHSLKNTFNSLATLSFHYICKELLSSIFRSTPTWLLPHCFPETVPAEASSELHVAIPADAITPPHTWPFLDTRSSIASHGPAPPCCLPSLGPCPSLLCWLLLSWIPNSGVTSGPTWLFLSSNCVLCLYTILSTTIYHLYVHVAFISSPDCSSEH